MFSHEKIVGFLSHNAHVRSATCISISHPLGTHQAGIHPLGSGYTDPQPLAHSAGARTCWKGHSHAASHGPASD